MSRCSNLEIPNPVPTEPKAKTKEVKNFLKWGECKRKGKVEIGVLLY